MMKSLLTVFCVALVHMQPVGNQDFAVELSKWALGERGILRASNVTHHRADGSVPPRTEGPQLNLGKPFRCACWGPDPCNRA
jgi:hypothetical protein